ncbi:MAG: Hsp20/alpha crystallin family protein [Pseudomonadales bacterium]
MHYAVATNLFPGFRPGLIDWLNLDSKNRYRTVDPQSDQSRPARSSASFDLVQQPDQYIIRLAMPGVAKEQVDITIEESNLLVTGDISLAESDGDTKMLHQGLNHQGFSRTFSLPKDADIEQINASADNGIISIYIPRHTRTARRKIEVVS